jgi:Flp pilus assembly protein TadD
VLGCLYSFAAPWVAARDVRSAYAAIDAGKARGAAGDGRRAHSLNPLAVDPLLAEAAAKEQLGDDGAARRLYVQAIDVQPLNWRPWFSLGSFEADRGNVALALRYVERASALNPRGIGVVTLLDQLRARSAGG